MICVLIAEGFEEIEALTPVDVLRRAGLEVKTVSIDSKKLVEGAHGIQVSCDALAKDIDENEIEALIFPGGMPGATNLDASEYTDKFIAAVKEKDGVIGAICAAPLILGRRGLLEGKRAVCFPGFENDLIGAEISKEGVAIDGKTVTARSMEYSLEFANAVAALIADDNAEAKKKLAEFIARSQSDEEESLVEFTESEEENDGGILSDKTFLGAIDIAFKTGKISTSLLQRKLYIGYGKAAKYIDIMENLGIVSEPNGQRPRELLMTEEEWKELLSRISIDD